MSVKKKNPVTGIYTTGHEWDGITEPYNPIPKVVKIAWVIAFTIAISVKIFYPSFPSL
jgi:cytochrome c oxidase cbb3-type subunit 3